MVRSTVPMVAQRAHRRRYSVAEYVRLEAHSNVKHEYFEGAIYAMAGGTPEHGALAAAVITELSNQLRDRPCRVYSSDARIRIQAQRAVLDGINCTLDVNEIYRDPFST